MFRCFIRSPTCLQPPAEGWGVGEHLRPDQREEKGEEGVQVLQLGGGEAAQPEGGAGPHLPRLY